MRRLLARLLLLLLGCVVALMLAEGLARALALAPEVGGIEVSSPAGRFVSSPDPVLRYVPRPGGADINSHGMRDRERQLERATGVARVALIGDSVAYGFCNGRGPLPLDALLNAQLERALGPGVEVLNFGVSGYNATQELRMLQTKALDFDPDLVLVAAVTNDDGDASMELEALQASEGWAQERAVARRMHGRVLFHSHLVRLVVARLATPERSLVGRARPAYLRLARLARERGFDARIVLFPDRADRRRQQHIDTIVDAASEAQLPLLDLEPTLFDRSEYYQPCSAMHPNARGLAAAAEAVAPFVAEGLAGQGARR